MVPLRGVIITRVDENPRELVICHAEGRGLHASAQAFRDAARTAGILMRVRHAQRAHVMRLSRRWGSHARGTYVLRAA